MAGVRQKGGAFGNSGTISGYPYGVEIYGDPGAVTNSGSITGTPGASFGVELLDGGAVANQSGGAIRAGFWGVEISGGAGAVTNGGAISTNGGGGIELLAGGTVVNETGGSIDDGLLGIEISGGGGTVTNSGAISTIATGASVKLFDGGTVANRVGGSIGGGNLGVEVSAGVGAVTNAGKISGASVGVELLGGGAFTNQAGGAIGLDPSNYGVFITGGAGKVANAGSIAGVTDSVKFGGAGANVLELQTGSVLTGAVAGSTATGATNTLELTGHGTADSAFLDFDTLSVLATGLWTLGATSTIAATTVFTGGLAVTGALTTALDEAAATNVTIAKGDTLTLNGASKLNGTTKGSGTLALTAGATIVDASAKVVVTHWSILGATASVTLDEALSYSGMFTAGSGAAITLSGGSLTLVGTATFSGATMSGAQGLVDSATTKITGLTIGGAGAFTNEGVLTQSGVVTLGDAAGDAAMLTNAAKGTWDITYNRGIALGGSTASSISNLGLFEKTGGKGAVVIAPAFDNGGEASVSSGALDLEGAVTGAGTDTISGAATLEFGSTVSDTQTIDFTGAGGLLDLASPTGFAGVVSGFDTIGTNDAVELLGDWKITGYTQTSAAEGALTLRDGAKSASLAFDGSYSKSLFDPVFGAGRTTITYG